MRWGTMCRKVRTQCLKWSMFCTSPRQSERVPPLHLYWPGAPHPGLAWPQSNRSRTASGAVIARWVPRFLMYIKTTSLLTCT